LTAIEDNFEFYFNLLYAVYSFPNIFLPLIGGILITKLGNRIMFLLYGSLIMAGEWIFAYGLQITSINTMLIGRIIFGLGGEGLGLCLSGMIVKWFYMDQIGYPLGISISISRIGSVLNGIISPTLSAVLYYLNKLILNLD
jgi:MFS family permease